MTRRSVAHRPPAEDMAPRVDVAQPDKESFTGGGFTALLESAAQEILAVSYWFDPALHPAPYPVTVRFSGHRVDVKGRLLPGDRFVHDETIQEVVPGSVGCFFAGCCGGPLTASHWGVWSSDQRVGGRRIPTQLLESVLALSLGLVALVVVLGHGPTGGAFFVAALAAYTLGRQGLLRLRAEARQTRLGGLATSALPVLVLIANVILLAR